MAQQWDPELLQGFFEESKEDIEQLEGNLVALRSNPSNPSTIQKAFRVVHSIKGNSGFFGVKNASRFCDRFEDMLDSLRTHKLSVTADVVELLLTGLDEIKLMLDQAEGGIRTSDLTPTQLEILERVAGTTTQSPVAVPAQLIHRIIETIAATEFEELTHREQIAATLSELLEDLVKICDDDEVAGRTNPEDAKNTDRPLPAQWNGVDVSSEIACINDWLRACEDAMEQPYPDEALASLKNVSVVDDTGIALLDDFATESKVLADAGLTTDAMLAGSLRERFSAFASHLNTAKPPADESQPTGADSANDKPQPKASPTRDDSQRKTILRVNQDRIDEFLVHIGDLILISKKYSVLGRQFEQISGTEFCTQEMKAVNQRFESTSQRLQKGVLGLRKVPAGTMLRTVPRMVTELADKLQKQVHVELVGEDVEADRSTLDLLKDPITHILRNSIDHGLETPAERLAQGKQEHGTIRLVASADKRFFSLTIEDDGRGINVDRVREKAIHGGVITVQHAATMDHQALCGLIFSAGLSTAEQQTDVSGRGVGMDVVMRNVAEASGQVTVDSTAGVGTTVNIRIPITGTLLVAGALMVEIAGGEYFIPTSDIQALVRPANNTPHRLASGLEAVRIRNEIHSFLRLEDLLPKQQSDDDEADPHWIILRRASDTVCIAIDRPLGIEQIIVMELEHIFPSLKIASGAALTGTGRVALVLNTQNLIASVTKVSEARCATRESELVTTT